MLKNHQMLLFCWLLQYFFFFVTSCHFTLLLVMVSDLELHSLISKHAEQKKKHEKNMHIEKVLDKLTSKLLKN